MKTLHLVGVVMVFEFTVSAVSAQLVKIDYEGWYDYIDQYTGKPSTDPGWVPVRFEAQAIIDLRSAVDVIRHDDYTEFTPRDGREEEVKNTIRWRAFGEELVFPANRVRVWESGRFDIAHYNRMSHLDLSLFLRAPLDPELIPVPPFEFPGGDAELGQVKGRYVLRGSSFLGSITRVTAELIPVPEPTTYGVASAVVLAFVILQQRRKRLAPSQR